MYALDKGLVDLINAQRAEAEEFSKQEGCFMGKMPEATELKYWETRVPTGTLKEYNRIELEETCYYMLCDAYSKSMARSLRYSVMTDEELEAEIEAAGNMIAMQSEAQCS
jgi:hypothetical protein